MRIGVLLLSATAAWLGGFYLLRVFGSVLPLAGFAIALTAAILATDAPTRALLKPRAVPFAAGGAAGALMIAATYLLYPVCLRLWPPLAGEVHGLYGLILRGLDRRALAAIVIVMSACEEIIFRGRLLEAPAGRRAARLAAGASFYALVHVGSGSPTLVAVALLCGLAWGVLRTLTRSLWTSIVCHVAWDLAIMLVAPLA